MEQNAFFPLFISLQDKKVVVVGGGKIASRRITTLLEFMQSVTVVAPEAIRAVEDFAEKGRVVLLERAFEEQDIQGAFLVVAATDRVQVNDRVAGLCREAGIMVNHAGDKEQCDFYFPGIVKDGVVVMGITASGSNHGLVRKLTDYMKERYREFKREVQDDDSRI